MSDKPESAAGISSLSTALLAEIDYTIQQIERGDHAAWDGDDFLALHAVLCRARGIIKANVKAEGLR